eukprot:945764-Rhodomonas_salina.1
MPGGICRECEHPRPPFRWRALACLQAQTCGAASQRTPRRPARSPDAETPRHAADPAANARERALKAAARSKEEG